MLALAALITFVLGFVLKLLGTSTGHVDLLLLGLAFVAAHLLVGATWSIRRP